MPKQNFRSLVIKAEQYYAKAEFQVIGNQGRAVLCQSRISDRCEIIGNQGRADMPKRNFRSLVIKAEQKCQSRTSGL